MTSLYFSPSLCHEEGQRQPINKQLSISNIYGGAYSVQQQQRKYSQRVISPAAGLVSLAIPHGLVNNSESESMDTDDGSLIIHWSFNCSASTLEGTKKQKQQTLNWLGLSIWSTNLQIPEFSIRVHLPLSLIGEPVFRVSAADGGLLYLKFMLADFSIFSFAIPSIFSALYEGITTSHTSAQAQQQAVYVKYASLLLNSGSVTDSLVPNASLLDSVRVIFLDSASDYAILVLNNDTFVSLSIANDLQRQQRGIVSVEHLNERMWRQESPSVWNLGKELLLSSLIGVSSDKHSSKVDRNVQIPFNLGAACLIADFGVNSFLASCSTRDGKLKIWDGRVGACVKSIPIHSVNTQSNNFAYQICSHSLGSDRSLVAVLVSDIGSSSPHLHIELFEIGFGQVLNKDGVGLVDLMQLKRANSFALLSVSSIEFASSTGPVVPEGIQILQEASASHFQAVVWVKVSDQQVCLTGKLDLENPSNVDWTRLISFPKDRAVLSANRMHLSPAFSIMAVNHSDGYSLLLPSSHVSKALDGVLIPSQTSMSSAAFLETFKILLPLLLKKGDDSIQSSCIESAFKNAESITAETIEEVASYLSSGLTAHVEILMRSLRIDEIEQKTFELLDARLPAFPEDFPRLFRKIADIGYIGQLSIIGYLMLALISLKFSSSSQMQLKSKLIIIARKVSRYLFPVSFIGRIGNKLHHSIVNSSKLGLDTFWIEPKFNSLTILTSLVSSAELAFARSCLCSVPKEGAFIYAWAMYYLRSSEFVKSRTLFESLYRQILCDAELAATLNSLTRGELGSDNIALGYLRHVGKVCGEYLAFDEALYFALIAQSAAPVDNLAVRIDIFSHAMELRRFNVAYQALVSIHDLKTFRMFLSHFVSVVAQSSRQDLLLRYPFPGRESELEECLHAKAVDSTWNSEPNFYKFLFAYYTSKSDHRSAAFWMLSLSQAIANSPIEVPPWISLLEQCKAECASLNSLSLVNEKEQWLPSSFGLSDETTIITIKELRKRYLLKLSKLELKREYESLDSTVPLKPEHCMSLCLNSRMWDRAMAIANQFNLDFGNIESSISHLAASS